MIINENGCGYGTFVADEQTLQEPATFWNGHDKEPCESYQPALILNFINKIKVTEIYFYCKSNSEINITSDTDKGLNRKAALNPGWNKISVNQFTDNLRCTLTKGTSLGEILVDCDKRYEQAPVTEKQSRIVLMQDFIGTNAFVDVPQGLLEPFGCVREYHDWPDWNEPQKDSFYLSVSKQGFDFENFYRNLDKAHKLIVPAVQKSPSWLTGESNVQSRPVPKNSNPGQPASYQRHALFLHKFASHFASPEKGNLRYIENWNEPDKWWEKGVSYFTPYQYASMSSADYDGHLSSLGKDKGIKNASSNTKLVLAGLANPKIDYLHALKYWCDRNRKGHFIWEVINYHRYANSAGLPDNKPEEGICPEKADLYKEAREIIKFRNTFAPESEVWISEFGYDTKTSPQQCKSIGAKSSEMVQADWLIRSYLILSAARVERAFQYMIRDFGTSGLYATSGYYTSVIKERPYVRPSWHYVNTLRYALYDTYFEKLAVDSSTGTYTAYYADKSNPSNKTKAVWLGTQEGRTRQYRVEQRSGATTVTEFSPDKPCGSKAPASDMITISETPVFITDNPKPCYSLKKVPAGEIKSIGNNGKINTTLLDEQDKADEKLFELTSSNPSSFWKNTYDSQSTNGIVFYFTTSKNIYSVQLFDGAGDGEIEISVRTQDGWKTETLLKMSQYNKWKTVVINKEVTEIKIEKTKGSPDMGEVVFFEKSSN